MHIDRHPRMWRCQDALPRSLDDDAQKEITRSAVSMDSTTDFQSVSNESPSFKILLNHHHDLHDGTDLKMRDAQPEYPAL
jgi:hypothetical protein